MVIYGNKQLLDKMKPTFGYTWIQPIENKDMMLCENGGCLSFDGEHAENITI